MSFSAPKFFFFLPTRSLGSTTVSFSVAITTSDSSKMMGKPTPQRSHTQNEGPYHCAKITSYTVRRSKVYPTYAEDTTKLDDPNGSSATTHQAVHGQLEGLQNCCFNNSLYEPKLQKKKNLPLQRRVSQIEEICPNRSLALQRRRLALPP